MRLFLTLLFAFTLSASGATYYIDYGAADDSANGTSTSTPWKRCPGMNGFAGSYSHTAGDKFIFKGGVTWLNPAFPLAITAGGSGSSVYDYYGVTNGWYSGAEWTRPIFDFQYTNIGNGQLGAGVQMSAVGFITFDNFELKNHMGAISAGSSENYGCASICIAQAAQSINILNCYIHDWKLPSAPTAGQDGGGGGGIVYAGSGFLGGCMISNNVLHCNSAGMNTGTPIYISGRICFNTVSNTATHCLANGNIHNNYFHHSLDPTDPDFHSNGILSQNGSTLVYDNLLHDLCADSTGIYVDTGINGGSGTSYVFNNVVHTTTQTPITVDVHNGSVVTNYIFNNTLQGSGTVILVGDSGSTGLSLKLLSITNNHFVIEGGDGIDGEGQVTTLWQANTVIQSAAEASTYGASAANHFKPTSYSAPTYQAGANLSAVFTTDRLDVTRTVPWDIGAYEYDPVTVTNWYVSPSGSSSGAGTLSSPWDITTGFSTNAITAGDTVWLRGGTYGNGTNHFLCTLGGTTNSPIIVRQYPGERAIIDGGIFANGAPYVWFWGFEITCSEPRTNFFNADLGSGGRPSGLIMGATGQKAINLVLRDTGHPGIFSQRADGADREITGCIISGTGIYQWPTNGDIDAQYSITNPWTRGAGLYLQNLEHTFYVSDNISFRNLTGGVKSYGENGYANGFNCDGNIVFFNGAEGVYTEVLYNSISNYVQRNNFTYHSGTTAAGYFGNDGMATHYGLVYSNNVVQNSPGWRYASIWLKRWKDMIVLSNTIVNPGGNAWFPGDGEDGNSGGKFLEIYPSTNTPLSYVVNGNRYYGGVEKSADWYDPTPGMFYLTYQPFRWKEYEVTPNGTNGELSFAAWTNSHALDVSSTYTTNLPTQNIVGIRTNKYERGRAHIAVFNWESNTTVTVNLSTVGLTNGQRFEVRDVQNYFGTPIVSASTYSGGTVELSLTSTNVTAVSVEGDVQYAHTSRQFNTFVVLPLEAEGAAPAAPRILRMADGSAGNVKSGKATK